MITLSRQDVATMFAGIDTRRDRLGSDVKRGVGQLLWEACKGRCAICDVAMTRGGSQNDPTRFVVSHGIPAAWFPEAREGDKRNGWAEGVAVLFGGCGRCNDRTGERFILHTVGMWANAKALITWTQREARAAAERAPRKGSSDHGDDVWASIEAMM